MPQDILRSAVYRSFVTCDDPKGVVECGTIRKSKHNPKRFEDKTKIRRMPEHLNSSSSSSSEYKEEGKKMVSEKVKQDFDHNPSSFQLMEVSRGAQKLNQVIDSWSKGINFDGNSKEIARDLLKGALDLQESLVMLGRLQEASQYMAKLKKQQKEKSKGERNDQVGIERTNSYHFTDRNSQMGSHKLRLSVDGYARDCYEPKEKSEGERIDQVGIERTKSLHFTDHNYQMGFQKPRLSVDGYSMDCFEQKKNSMGERIDQVGVERTRSYHFTDHNYQTGIQNPRLSAADGYSRDCFEQKEKSMGERIDQTGIERTNSYHFTDHNYQTGVQKPRLSVDGSPRDCFDELRTAIRDGLARQNLLRPTSIERKAFRGKREMDSACDIASSSSSQSSMVSFHDSTSFDSSVSSKAPHKSKGSNLIAKLMGLEEIPSQPVQTTSWKQFEREKISSERRAVFDIDMPKARKPQPAGYMVETEPVKLKEIVETMQFKGLLKGNSAEGFGLQSHHSNALDSKKRFTEDAPPIVIMKPWCFSSSDSKEPHPQKFNRDVERNLNSNEMGRRVNGDETPIKRLSREGDKSSKVVKAKSEEIAVNTNEKLPSSKFKASVPVKQQQREKAVEKKVDRIQKVALRRKKQAEVENVKSKAAIKSGDEARVTSPKERKTEVGSIVTKSRTSQQKSNSLSVISKLKKPAISHECGYRKKKLNNERPVKEPSAANLVVENENVGCKYGDKLIDLRCENEADMTRISTTTADKLLIEEQTDAPEIEIEEQCDISQNSLSNVVPRTTQNESFKSAEETKHCINQNTAETKCFRTEMNAKDLFLSSPSFLSYAEELFDVNPNQAMALHTTSLKNLATDDTGLLLDCANELMQQKNLRCTQTVNPLLLTPMRSSNASISLVQLVDEVCDGIENLRSYSMNAGEKLSSDSLFAVLIRDLRCQGVVNGGWDSVWKHGFGVDDVEQIVGEIEKLVLNGLVEDMFTDFML